MLLMLDIWRRYYISSYLIQHLLSSCCNSFPVHNKICEYCSSFISWLQALLGNMAELAVVRPLIFVIFNIHNVKTLVWFRRLSERDHWLLLVLTNPFKHLNVNQIQVVVRRCSTPNVTEETTYFIPRNPVVDAGTNTDPPVVCCPLLRRFCPCPPRGLFASLVTKGKQGVYNVACWCPTRDIDCMHRNETLACHELPEKSSCVYISDTYSPF